MYSRLKEIRFLYLLSGVLTILSDITVILFICSLGRNGLTFLKLLVTILLRLVNLVLYSPNLMKEEEVGGTCSTNGKVGSVYRILLRQVYEKSKFGDLGVGMRIILKYILVRR